MRTETLTSKALALLSVKQQEELTRLQKEQLRQQDAEQKLLDAFEQEFHSLLPLLRADGIKYCAKLNDPQWPDLYGGYIEFSLEKDSLIDQRDIRTVCMDITPDGTYRYEHVNRRHVDSIARSVYAKWPKDEFILWLADGLKLI